MTTSVETRPNDRLLTRLVDWFDMPDVLRLIDRPLWANHIRVEEERHDDRYVVRAEMPGIDPEHDVEIDVVDGLLTIRAERREEHREEREGRTVSEFRYGSSMRSLAVPKGVSAENVTATYRDGILEITVPFPAPVAAAPTKVAISRS